MSPSELSKCVKELFGPASRVAKIQRAGVEGVQVLDDKGRVLHQSFGLPVSETFDRVLATYLRLRP